MIDYHVHTSLCNHAVGSMEQYVRAAVAAGLKEICFLDHLTLHEKGKHLSMAPADLPLYFHAARRLAQVYRDKIMVKVGLELDMDPAHTQQLQDIISIFSFDMIGGSIHFIQDTNIVSSKDGNAARDQMDIADICGGYLEKIDAMLDADIIDVVCHLDVTKKFGRQTPKGFEHKYDEILSKIRYKNLAVELNTSGLAHGAAEFYPGPRLLALCREKGIPVTLGSDSHVPSSVGQHYDKAIQMLTATGYTHVAAFTRRQRYDIALNGF
jgi:histidinol-phosphatase (PHP family)